MKMELLLTRDELNSIVTQHAEDNGTEVDGVSIDKDMVTAELSPVEVPVLEFIEAIFSHFDMEMESTAVKVESCQSTPDGGVGIVITVSK